MNGTDKELTRADIQALANRDAIVSFFAKLGYRTDIRMTQTCAAMGITAESLQRQIKHIERVVLKEGGAEPLDIYVIELTSVTMIATQGLARALRNRVGNYFLVLTDDYERIDFVLLERSLPTASSAPLSTKQVVVRPRILTVARRSPTQVQLRVLRRFSCTEIDSDAQYEKLLSAYSVAEWSEPLFNNRALFSDYYLNERLPERPEWRERSEPAYQSLRQLITNIRQRLSSEDRESTRELLVEPALSTLGFKAISTENSRHCYRLSSNTNSDTPVALCLAYTWNRNLDGWDETRDTETPDENPGAKVVNLLESGEAPWAIVTNGKLWRLYSARAHSRATNYYEIDLDENLAMDDPNEAFRYFWLFFRAPAFIPRDIVRDGQSRSLAFLDELVEESEDYAKSLGERLKDRVFEEIFPHFAKGFIEYLRSQPPITSAYQSALLPLAQQLALKKEPDETFRRQVFQGTLTFLYRLLFLLYAESRGLLPVKEERGYWEHSITRMKEEIASKAGKIIDEAPQKLAKAYSEQSTALYDRILELFGHIDQGSREMNVPLYNGGLFISKPASNDHTPEAENAKFLLSNKIPDRYLALGLDRLTRDEDQKRHDLVFIDYKSLGVRQLGSIYEGLLEFRIRIAPEKMAVVQGKKTEEVIPYSEAVKTGHKILTRGRGKNAIERVYQPGEVYLENDRRERKATGSYYTPDHIVKYIVQHTIGIVLENKFEKLRSIFREAQQAYRNALQRAEGFRKQGMKPDNPAKVANTYRHLVDELFDLRVLDPAMGSGHFLVEAVDFLCDRILGQKEGFLQAFPWNPVTAFLQETRQAILTEMERQNVTIDASRLTDINLLKRHILKRCIYGVDLNPMAVELAKVSLWLDCFTLGAPLSFLDHHLKCGNSLIGITVQEVEAELAAQKKGHVGDLFGGPFQGLLSATAFVEELRRLPDATIEQAERSHALYNQFEEAMAPYKAALDIWVSRYFGNKLAQEYLTLVGQNYVEEIRSGGEGLSPQYREVITKAAEISRERRLFHWDLEFPEAFVDLERNTWKAKDGQGFDALIGNPPYVRIQTLEDSIAKYLLTRYESSVGKFDIYLSFIERGYQNLLRRGHLGYIVPNKFMTSDYGLGLRRFISRLQALEHIVDFGDSQIFPGTSTYVCLVFLSREPATVVQMSQTSPSSLFNSKTSKIKSSLLSEAPWNSATGPVILLSTQQLLGHVCEAIFQGLITGADQLLIGRLHERTVTIGDQQFVYEPNVVKPLLKGKDIGRFVLNYSGYCVIFPYSSTSSGTTLIPERELADEYPATYAYLLRHKSELMKRGSASMEYEAWYSLWCPRQVKKFESPKILTQVLAPRGTFGIDPNGEYWFVGGGNAGVYGIVPKENLEIDIWYLLAILNSRRFDEMVKASSSRFRGGYFSYAKRFIERIPVPVLGFSAQQVGVVKRISELAQDIYTTRLRNSLKNSTEEKERELDILVDEIYSFSESRNGGGGQL